MKTDYDVIVVGAGSAGCALAYRLAATTDSQVLLLEAGSPAYNPMIHIPLGFAFLMKPHRNNWGYSTVPEPALGGRSVNLPRGKVLGGTSAINGMVYVRGQAEDYDNWAALGNAGWSYRDVLPLFKRSEDHGLGANDYHGVGGPLYVGSVSNEFPVVDAFIAAAEQAGHAANDDFNGASQAGVGFFATNIKRGTRFTAAKAFLRAGRGLRNLTVMTGAYTHRVLVENGRAVGVECELGNALQTFRASQEVVLSAGAINSPKILECSGIGQADLLHSQGVKVVQDLPGVGENLHDHWNGYQTYAMSRGDNYYRQARPLAMLKNITRYLFTRQSFLSNPAAMVAVFYNALGDSERPDSQVHFAAAASDVDAQGNVVPVDGVMVSNCGLRPTSRGSTHIAATDWRQSPAIQVNYLQTEHDQRVAIEGFRRLREMMAAEALQPFGGAEIAPGRLVDTDADILRHIASTGDPVHHLAGSCKMGGDIMAVVDNQLRVHGIERLRVADASIMPQIVSGNTHAACVMIGEKAADYIAGAH